MERWANERKEGREAERTKGEEGTSGGDTHRLETEVNIIMGVAQDDLQSI